MKVDVYSEIYTEQIIHHSPPGPDVVGLENLIYYFLDIRKALSNTCQTIHQIVAEGDEKCLKNFLRFL